MRPNLGYIRETNIFFNPKRSQRKKAKEREREKGFKRNDVIPLQEMAVQLAYYSATAPKCIWRQRCQGNRFRLDIIGRAKEMKCRSVWCAVNKISNEVSPRSQQTKNVLSIQVAPEIELNTNEIRTLLLLCHDDPNTRRLARPNFSQSFSEIFMNYLIRAEDHRRHRAINFCYQTRSHGLVGAGRWRV